MKRRILPILLALLSLWAVSCGKHEPEPAVDPEKKETDFSIDISISDGVIDREKVLSAPSVSFTVRSLSEDSNYIVAYQVDGTETQYVRNLWANKSRDISSSFREFETYGKHTLKGKIYEENNEEDAVPFEKEVWIRYSQINVESVYFSSFAGDVPTKAATLNTSEKGILYFRFSPGSSFAEFSVKSSNEGVLSFNYDNPVIDSGLYGLRYAVGDAPGEANVTLSVKNADTTLLEDSFTVTTKQGKIAPTIHFDTSFSPLYFVGSTVRVVPSVTIDSESSSQCSFIASFSLDGKPVGQSEPFSVDYESVVDLSSQGLQPGWHEFTITVSAEKYIMDEVEDKVSFYVLEPVLQVTHDGTTAEYSKNQSIKLKTGESYEVMAKELPAEVSANLKLHDTGIGTVTTTETGWILNVRDYGSSVLSLQIVKGGTTYDETLFTTERQLAASITFSLFDGDKCLSAILDYAGDQRPEVSVSGEFIHYGYGESYPTVFDGDCPMYSTQPEYTDETTAEISSTQVKAEKTFLYDYSSLIEHYEELDFSWMEYSDEGLGYQWYCYTDYYHLRLKGMKLVISGIEGGPLDSHIEMTCKMGNNMSISSKKILGLDSEPTVNIIQ